MTEIDKEKQKLVARIKRIRGQVDSIERSLSASDDCADILMLLANVDSETIRPPQIAESRSSLLTTRPRLRIRYSRTSTFRTAASG